MLWADGPHNLASAWIAYDVRCTYIGLIAQQAWPTFQGATDACSPTPVRSTQAKNETWAEQSEHSIQKPHIFQVLQRQRQ